MVCLACISVIGFIIAMVAKFLGDFLGIGWFKSAPACPARRKTHSERVAAAAKTEAPAGKGEAEAESEEGEENPFARPSAFEGGDAPKCPFSAAGQSHAKKRE